MIRSDGETSTTYFQEMVICENPFKIHLLHNYEILQGFQEHSKEATLVLLTLELLVTY